MLTFKYRTISKTGEKVRGVIEAYDEFEAVARLRQDFAIVESIEEVEAPRTEGINLNEPLWISEKTLSLTANQFAILLRAGFPAAKTVAIIAEQISDKLMKKVLMQVKDDVEAGYGLASSLEARGKKIPVAFIETVRAGEQSGTLEGSFEKLSEYYEKRAALKSKVRGATRYPLILIFLSIVVVAIVVKITVPVVLGTILRGGGKVPWPTAILLAVYNFFASYGIFFLTVLIALVIAFRIWRHGEKGRMWTSKKALKLPVLGNINAMNAASQFASTMATLLAAGLPVRQAVSITSKVMDNYAAANTVAKCTVGLEEGKRLGAVLEGNPYLPTLLVEMTAVGEASGSLEDTLTTIGSYYDREVETQSAAALSMLEPMLTIFLGILIGFIVIALYLPMFTMYDYIG